MRPLESAAPQGSEEPVIYEIARQRAHGAIRAAKRLESRVLPVSADQISRSSARAFSKFIDQATLENHDVPEPKRSRVRAAAERKVQELTGALDYAQRLRYVPLVRRDLEQLRIDLDNPARVAQAARTFYAAGDEIAGTETRAALTERTPVDLGYAHVGALREAQARRNPKYAARKAAQANIDVLHTHLDIETGHGRTPPWRQIISIFADHAAVLDAQSRRSEALRLKSLIQNIEYDALRSSILVHFRTAVEVPFAEDLAPPTVARQLKIKCRKSFRTLRRHCQAAALRLTVLAGTTPAEPATISDDLLHLGGLGNEREAVAGHNDMPLRLRAVVPATGAAQLREDHDLFDPINAPELVGPRNDRRPRTTAMPAAGLAERLRSEPMTTLVSVLESHFAHTHRPVLLALPNERLFRVPMPASDEGESLGYMELAPDSPYDTPRSSPSGERAEPAIRTIEIPEFRTVEPPRGIEVEAPPSLAAERDLA